MRERSTFGDVALRNDKLLLSKISSGDEVAFRMLFDGHRKWVYSYALKIIKSKEQAEEILLDVFLKIWQHENPAQIENLECYLRTITRNLTISALRRHKLELVVSHQIGYTWEEGHNQTEEAILLKDTAGIYNEAVDLLTPQQKLVYNLCRVEGLKYSQAAERLDISPLTVKTHMQHALRFLRNYIDMHSRNVGIWIILLPILLNAK